MGRKNKSIDPELARLRAKVKRLRGLVKGRSRSTVIIHIIHPKGKPVLTYESTGAAAGSAPIRFTNRKP